MKACPHPDRDLKDLSLAEVFTRIGCRLHSEQYCGLQDQYFALLRGISFPVCPELIVDPSKKSTAMDVQSACLKSSHHNASFGRNGPPGDAKAQKSLLEKCVRIDNKTAAPRTLKKLRDLINSQSGYDAVLIGLLVVVYEGRARVRHMLIEADLYKEHAAHRQHLQGAVGNLSVSKSECTANLILLTADRHACGRSGHQLAQYTTRHLQNNTEVAAEAEYIVNLDSLVLVVSLRSELNLLGVTLKARAHAITGGGQHEPHVLASALLTALVPLGIESAAAAAETPGTHDEHVRPSVQCTPFSRAGLQACASTTQNFFQIVTPVKVRTLPRACRKE